MQIALLAHDNKKELMADFCNAYCGVLSRHELVATAATANVVHDLTGLTVKGVLAGPLGGSQQIARLIACGEVDMVLMFNDYNARNRMDDAHNILRLCDMYTVPVATNIASAELLIHGLARGDLDWRKIKMDEISETQVG